MTPEMIIGVKALYKFTDLGPESIRRAQALYKFPRPCGAIRPRARGPGHLSYWWDKKEIEEWLLVTDFPRQVKGKRK